MATEPAEYRHSKDVERHLMALREDHTRVVGAPFEHFLCPILLEDKPVPLCMGHIINEACPNSFRVCVVQRKDVDNFFGRFAESDFTGMVQTRSMSPRDALLDPKMSKKLHPKIIANGEELKHYPYRGAEVPEHTKVAVHVGDGGPLLWMVKKKPEEIEALQEFGVELRIGKDCRLTAFVSLIKAAYLTLFKLLGYSYALSADGRKIGYGVDLPHEKWTRS